MRAPSFSSLVDLSRPRTCYFVQTFARRSHGGFAVELRVVETKYPSAFAGHANAGVEVCKISISPHRIMTAASDARRAFWSARRFCRAKQRHRREDEYHYRASAGDRRVVSRGGVTSDVSFPCGRKGAPTPPVRECAAPAEQLELISPGKFQLATPQLGACARNPRTSCCTDPW